MQTPQAPTKTVRRVVRSTMPGIIPDRRTAENMVAERIRHQAQDINQQVVVEPAENNTVRRSSSSLDAVRAMQDKFKKYGENVKIINHNIETMQKNDEEEIEIDLPQNNPQPIQQQRRTAPTPTVNRPIGNVATPRNTAPQTVFNPPAADTFAPPLNSHVKVKPSIKNSEHDARVNSPTTGESHGQRFTPASRNLFYGDISIEIRPLDIVDIGDLYAAKVSDDESAFIDVVDRVLLNFDARDLTLPDFRHAMYWLKLNSFTNTPYKLRFRSLYGHTGYYTIKNSNLQITSLNADIDDLIGALEFGLDVPRVRDMEEYNSLELSEKEKFLFKKARYVSGNSVREKLHNFNTKFTPDALFTTIPNFIEQFDSYGVIEKFETVDPEFQASEAVDYLNNRLIEFQKLLLNIQSQPISDNSQMVDAIYAETVKITDEILRINTALAETGEAAPLSETFEFSLSIADFFPDNT